MEKKIKLTMKIFRQIALTIMIVLLSTSCTLAKFSKFNKQIEVMEVTKVEIKGMSGVQLEVRLRNSTKQQIALDNTQLTIKINGDKVGNLVQVDKVSSPPSSETLISSLWRIESVDAMTLFALAAKISKRDLSGMSVDFSAELTADDLMLPLSGKDIDISNLMSSLSL